MIVNEISDSTVWAVAYDYFFNNAVKEPDNEGFRYLIGRHNYPEQQFKQNIYGLGWSPLGDGLAAHLSLKGISLEHAEELGLIIFEDGKPHDAFQDRIIFPLRNVQGEVVGFSALRAVRGEQPVYLNRCSGNRSSALFGLDVAMPFIRNLGFAEILEFPDAVIDEYYCGRRNAVSFPLCSFMRSADREGYVKTIKSITDKVVLKYHSDHLGNATAEQDKKLLESAGITVDIELIE